MKHDELFEVVNPPAHGLTRLRGKLASRRANRLLRPALVFALAAAVSLVFVPRGATEPAADLRNALLSSLLGAERTGPSVSALDARTLGVERLPSSNPKVLVYRVALLVP